MTALRHVDDPNGKPWRVVPFRPEHSTLVAELQRHLWSPDVQSNAEYLNWKYFENPYIREPLLYLAFVEDRLVGMRGAFGSRWEVGEPAALHTLPYADDLVIDPGFRGRGLHRAIMRFAFDDLAARGYQYVVNLSSGRATRVLSLRMNWRESGQMAGVDRRSSRAAAVDGFKRLALRMPLAWRYADAPRRFLPVGDHLFDVFDSRAPSRGKGSSTGAIFAQPVPLHDEMERLIDRLPKTGAGRIRHVRDQTYFRWRFRNPKRRYRFLYAGGDRIEGYLVLQHERDADANHVSIVDWEAERAPVLDALLASAIRFGRFPRLSAWVPESPSVTGHMLARRGFEPTERRQPTLVRSMPDAKSGEPWRLSDRSLDDAGEWDLRMLYSMKG